jgi:glycosyltransferase involved in cell wall biosynthesis
MTLRKGPIVFCFGVLDEADILEYFLAYHLSIGIDAFVAVDVGSTDGTLDILERHERAGHLHLFRANGTWNWPMLEMARERYGAEWCLLGDADEFWIFPENNARAYLDTAPSQIVLFSRYNVLPSKNLDCSMRHFTRFDHVVHNPIHFFYHQPTNVLENFRTRRDDPNYAAMLLRNYPPEILRKVEPKVVARPESVQSLLPGYHNVVSVPEDALRHRESAGYVAHFPMRSVDRFKRKAAHVAKLFEQVERDPDRSWHWARLSVLFKHNLVEEEFSRQVLSESARDQLMLESVIRKDPRLLTALARVRGIYRLRGLTAFIGRVARHLRLISPS